MIAFALQVKSIMVNLTEEDIAELKRLFSEGTIYRRYSECNAFIKDFDVKADKNSVSSLINLANAAEKTDWDTIRKDIANNIELEVDLMGLRFEASLIPDVFSKEMDPFITPIILLAFTLSKKMGLDTSFVPPYASFRNRKE